MTQSTEERQQEIMSMQELPIVGSEYWFEYHCWESPESSDATVWYHSHQKVTVLSLNFEYASGITLQERCENAAPVVAQAQFTDGLIWDIYEDELLDSPEQFACSDPPTRQ